MSKSIAWMERLIDLKIRLGREPTLEELLEEAKKHEMTPEEIRRQRESFVRGMMSTGDPRFD